jgi:hypothetical protein
MSVEKNAIRNERGTRQDTGRMPASSQLHRGTDLAERIEPIRKSMESPKMRRSMWNRLARIETEARRLARSGNYQSFESIEQALLIDGYCETPKLFRNRWTQLELNRICQEARSHAGEETSARPSANTPNGALVQPRQGSGTRRVEPASAAERPIRVRRAWRHASDFPDQLCCRRTTPKR